MSRLTDEKPRKKTDKFMKQLNLAKSILLFCGSSKRNNRSNLKYSPNTYINKYKRNEIFHTLFDLISM